MWYNLTFERTVGDHGKTDAKTETRTTGHETCGDWIEDMCVIISHGDISRRDAILWGYTLAECEPYLRACIRNITFREAVLAFLEIRDQGSGVGRVENLKSEIDRRIL
ncbi:MAG: hypothetical protein CV087_04725 [Candidatus Brocadia sp. WS118]|nr:MAG: hypothetical protein CV087_04725 [Candidatus Brocadia sp. WS118]